MKIVVIEDNHLTAYMYGAMLRIMGYRDIIIEKNPILGLSHVMFEKPHVVICDINLPNINGTQVIQEIRDNPLVYNNPRIIAITADTLTYPKVELKKLGATEVLYKPFTISELQKVIDIISEKQVESES